MEKYTWFIPALVNASDWSVTADTGLERIILCFKSFAK